MKFISWNVNGLRACIQKGFLDEFQRLDADFFCLQETKLSAGQLRLHLPGYEQYWCYAEKKGYSGTAIFTKHTPLSVSYGIGREDLDNEGRVITLEYQEFYLLTCYTPNAQRGLARIDHRMAWDEAFRAYLQELDAVKPVIICGDLNVAHQQIDLKNPAANRGNAGFSDEERGSFQKTLDLGFTDTFRHLYPDVTGRYSWWSYMFHARENNAGWRIDYFLVSDRLQASIQEADIYSNILGSDHCPVMLELDTLVNGSIWSPSTGTPSVIETETAKKKSPKASPVNGKAFALLCLLVAFVVTIVFLPSLLDDFGSSATEPPIEEGQPITIHVLENSFQMVPDLPTHQVQISFVQYFSDRLSHSDSTYYIDSFDVLSLSSSNFWLRLELTDYGRQICTDSDALYVMCFSDVVSSTLGPSYLQNIFIIPYYADASHSEFQGWLIWGMLRASDSLWLSIDQIEYFESVYVDIIEYTIIEPETEPPLDIDIIQPYFTVHSYYTPPSLTYVFEYDSNLAIKCLSILTDDRLLITYLNEDPLEWESACFWFYISLPDETLKNLNEEEYTFTYSESSFTTSVSNTNCIPCYTDTSLTQIGGWLLYGSDSSVCIDALTLNWDGGKYTYPDTLSILPYIRKTEAKAMSTFELCEHILTHWGFHDLLSNLLQIDIQQLIQNYPAFAELTERDDAVSELMNFPVDGYPQVDEMRAVAFFLLRQYIFRSKMSPEEEALYILNSYSSCPYIPFDLTVDPELDLSEYSTDYVLTLMCQHSAQWESFFDSCSSYETREAMYRILRVSNLIALELETRDDVGFYLEDPIYSDLGAYLMELLPVMQELNGTSQITEENPKKPPQLPRS